MKDYYSHLGRVQNHTTILAMPIDIMTITGFMNDAQKMEHLMRYSVITEDVKAIDFVLAQNTAVDIDLEI